MMVTTMICKVVIDMSFNETSMNLYFQVSNSQHSRVFHASPNTQDFAGEYGLYILRVHQSHQFWCIKMNLPGSPLRFLMNGDYHDL